MDKRKERRAREEAKNKQRLGMSTDTASHRLAKDLLFKFVFEAGHKCHRCGGRLDRETFSIDHIEPWRTSINPAFDFFHLPNIAYSHRTCNSKEGSITRGKQIKANGW